MFKLMETYTQNAVIKVIGVGGGGGNSVRHMTEANIDGVDFICANTDAQALKNVGAKTVLQLGEKTTEGLGAGADPAIGRQAAMDDLDRIKEAIEQTDMLFITAGMGGGTGTGAAPVVARAAKELGILTVAVVTKPFAFEGKKRMTVAEAGIRELEEHVDSLIIIPNEKLVPVLGKDTPLLEAFKEVHDILLGAVRGIAELITRPGLINVDFADVRAVMREMGMAMMGSAVARGQDRARKAAERAVSSPLLEDVDLANVGGILVNVTAGPDLTMGEYDEALSAIKEFAAEDATIIIGMVVEPEMSDKLRVTVVVTGIGEGGAGDNIRRLPLRGETPQTATARAVPPSYAAAVESQAAAGLAKAVGDEDGPRQPDFTYLDLPAFLRKQAD